MPTPAAAPVCQTYLAIPPCVDEKAGPSPEGPDDLPDAPKKGDHKEHHEADDPPESVCGGAACPVNAGRKPARALDNRYFLFGHELKDYPENNCENGDDCHRDHKLLPVDHFFFLDFFLTTLLDFLGGLPLLVP